MLCKKVYSCEVCKSLDAESLPQIERSQKWLGHVTTMPQERLAEQVLLATLMGKRPRRQLKYHVARLHLQTC